MLSERIRTLCKKSAERGQAGKPSHFYRDYHSSALGTFSALPHGEKLARAMAFAIENQDVWVYEDDGIGGRIYYNKEAPIPEMSPELDCMAEAYKEFHSTYPEAWELMANQLIAGTAKGHITWFFDRILRLGTEKFREQYETALKNAADKEAEDFYRGVIILIDAMQSFNDKHIAEYEKIGNHDLATLMKKVPRHPCENFREAVQAFFLQHIVVMRENPFGGNGPGRLDYYLWPYLEADLAAGRCTLEDAKELIDELFLRIDERIHCVDTWVEAIVVGGTHPDGRSAVNPLTYIMIQSIMDLNVTHPSIYVRLPKDPSEELLNVCAAYITSGNNRAQILYDPAVIDALMKRGTPFEDAVNYACGGCMEVGIQGMTSDFLFIGWQNTAKMLELMITGGVCLKTKKRVNAFQATKSLAAYGTFEEFYSDFIAEADRITKIFLHEQDIYSKYAEKNRPSYLISSMIDNCLERGRNMHGGGAKYHDYGGSPVALPNVADGLYAIKVAVFDRKICAAEELIAALEANFQGYEKLQARLRSIPKYGMDDPDADEMAARVMRDFANIYASYTTRFGGKGKLVILTFIWSPTAASLLGATADGRNAGLPVAQGVTPQSPSMTEGITAAINSCGRMPFECFAGGASTLWDLDNRIATPATAKALLKTFIENGGQIYQGNTTPVEELLDAREHPDRYPHLMVRVGGYSARFVHLDPGLQDDIINRTRHER